MGTAEKNKRRRQSGRKANAPVLDDRSSTPRATCGPEQPDAYDEIILAASPAGGGSIPSVRKPLPLYRARYEFLCALSKRQPRVLQSLREGPFTIFSSPLRQFSIDDIIAGTSQSEKEGIVRDFSSLSRRMQRRSSGAPLFDEVSSAAALATNLEGAWRQLEREKRYRNFNSALDNWFREWRFSDAELGFVDWWVREAAIETIQWWYENPNNEKWFLRYFDSSYSMESQPVGTRAARPYEPEPLKVDFGPPPYYEPGFSWKKRAELAHWQLDVALRHERDIVKAHAETAGIPTAPTKRKPDHFDWLARRFLGETCGDIWRSLPSSKRGGRTPRAVQTATSELADYIGLPLSDRQRKKPANLSAPPR